MKHKNLPAWYFFNIGLVIIFLIAACTPEADAPINSSIIPSQATPSWTSTLPPSPTIYATFTPTFLPTITPTLRFPEASRLLEKYGWSIRRKLASQKEILPGNFLHRTGDFPHTLYWAYGNELSQEIGLDLTPYLGQSVETATYLLNESLPKELIPYTEARAIVISSNSQIIGAWIEKRQGFACALNQKPFDKVINQPWGEWLVSAGIVDISDPLEVKLAKKSPEEIIEVYYKALEEHDYPMLYAIRSRRSQFADLSSNKFDPILFNTLEKSSFYMWVENIDSAKILEVQKQGGPNDCLPIYSVYVEFKFVNPKMPSISDGKHMQFIVVNREIPGLGWKIEEINTAPGVSERLCREK